MPLSLTHRQANVWRVYDMVDSARPESPAEPRARESAPLGLVLGDGLARLEDPLLSIWVDQHDRPPIACFAGKDVGEIRDVGTNKRSSSRITGRPFGEPVH